VNALSPGPTGTDLFLKGKNDELIKTFANASPSGKVSEPEQIADVVGFLASENSRWVNRQNIRVNEGMATRNLLNCPPSS